MLDFNSYWILFVQAIKYCISTYCYVILCKLLPLENGSERCWLDCSLLQFSPIFKYLSQWKYRKSSMSNGSSQRYKRGNWMPTNKAMRKNGKNPNGKNNWFLKNIFDFYLKNIIIILSAYRLGIGIPSPLQLRSKIPIPLQLRSKIPFLLKFCPKLPDVVNGHAGVLLAWARTAIMCFLPLLAELVWTQLLPLISVMFVGEVGVAVVDNIDYCIKKYSSFK